jgi:hypothetical protein
VKVLDVMQGSPEWLQARLGIPTASAFDRIISPKKLQASTQAPTYRNQLLAEWLLGHPIDWGGSSQFMDRGTAMEPEARAYYAFHKDVEVQPTGFILRDDEMVGGSPDGLVGEDGGLEIKAPAIHTHIGYLLEPESLVAEYHSQVQGYLYLTGRAWWDILSYNPDLPGVIVRIEPDPRYQAALGSALDAFVGNLLEARAALQPHKNARDASVAAVRRELREQEAAYA